MTPDLVFRDPYLLDFLGLKDTFQEEDLEAAILRELEAFIMELGGGFTFVARQKRITVDEEVLQRKLHEAIVRSRLALENRCGAAGELGETTPGQLSRNT